MRKIIVPIKGMHCRSCELMIEENLHKVPHIKKAEVSHVSGRAKIWFEGKEPSQASISKAVEDAGYALGMEDKRHWFSRNPRDYFYVVNAAAILLFLFIVAQLAGVSEISTNFNRQTITMSLVIGLIAGVSSCMALIGGLVLGISARHSELHPEATRMQKFRPHLFFNLGRILGFALLGGVIGLIGGALQPTPKFMAILTLAVGAVMVLLGLKLVEIFPVLDRITITLPKSLARLLGYKRETKEYSHGGAFMAGVLTFFLPCGFTQAMQLYAISTGSFASGALIMSLFAVGTAPGLLGIGGLASAFKGGKARLFFAAAGLAVIILGIYNINNASRIVFPQNNAAAVDADQQADLQTTQVLTTVYRTGADIVPNKLTAKVGQPVKVLVDVKDNAYGCMSTIMIPGLYNEPQFLSEGKTLAMEFVPKKKGSYPITCAMGIKRGVIVIE